MERQIRAIEAGQYGAYPHRRTSGTWRRTDGQATSSRPTRRTCRARSSPWIRAPAPCARSSAAATSTTAKFDRADAGASTAGIDVQADRLRRRRAERAAAVVHCSTTLRSRFRCSGSSTWTPQNFEGKLRGQDAHAPRALQSRNVADDRARHRARRRRASSTRRASSALTTPIPRVSVDLHRRRRRLPDRDGLRVHGVRHARHARQAERRSCASRTRRETCSGSRSRRPSPVMTPEEAWLMVSMMKDVVQRGTAAGSVGITVPLSRRRQDGNDQRRRRRLVHRLHVGPRRRRVDGLRQAAEDQDRTRRAASSPRRCGRRSCTTSTTKRPAPRDWPMPGGHRHRGDRSRSTNMLATPYCPPRGRHDRVLHSRHRSDRAVRRPHGAGASRHLGCRERPPRRSAADAGRHLASDSRRRALRASYRFGGHRASRSRQCDLSRLRRAIHCGFGHTSAARSSSRRLPPTPVACPKTFLLIRPPSFMTWQSGRLPRALHATPTASSRSPQVIERARQLGVRPSLADHISRDVQQEHQDASTAPDAISTTSTQLRRAARRRVLLARPPVARVARRRPCAASRTASVRCTPCVCPTARSFTPSRRDLPDGLSPFARTWTRTSRRSSRSRSEMPVDVLAHPDARHAAATARSISTSCGPKSTRRAWSCARCSTPASRSRSRSRYRPHERLVRRAADARRSASRSARMATPVEQVADIAARWRSRARSACATRISTIRATRLEDRDGHGVRRMIRYRARWVRSDCLRRPSPTASLPSTRETDRVRRPACGDAPPATTADVDLGDACCMPGSRQRALPPRAHRDARLPRGSRLPPRGSFVSPARDAPCSIATLFSTRRGSDSRRACAPASRPIADTCDSGVVIRGHARGAASAA